MPPTAITRRFTAAALADSLSCDLHFSNGLAKRCTNGMHLPSANPATDIFSFDVTISVR
jgi:hypothetical protein